MQKVLTPEQIREVVEMRENGQTWDLIAKRFDVTRQTVAKTYQRATSKPDAGKANEWARAYWRERGICYDTGRYL